MTSPVILNAGTWSQSDFPPPVGSTVSESWREDDQELSVGVADICFYEADHRSLHRDRVAQAQAWLANSAYVLLSLGLSRPYRRSEKDHALHWLQVNNIHWG